MATLAGAHGWTDRQILGLTLRRLRQAFAAALLQQWEADLAARRLATVQLRTVCAYIAATMQLAEGQENPMLTHAAHLDLGPGTRNTGTPPPAPTGPGDDVVRPGARVNVAELPDAPPGIRPGQAAPLPAGLRPLDAGAIGAMFGGGL